MTLSEKDKRTLLRIARQAIESKVFGKDLPDLDVSSFSPSLRKEKACFVTLMKGGELRGCVGALDARQPLVKEVQDRAIAAAFGDYRFPPLREDELEEVRIEISCLSPPRVMEYSGPDELTANITPGEDGVILSKGSHQATFLPQVWDKLPDIEDFLTRLCLKMGEKGSLWREKKLEARTYQVEKFGES